MAKLTITGRVLVRESHQGVAGVVVRAVWVLDEGKELHVGSAVSTDRGAFVVSGEAADGTQTLRVIVDAPLGSAFDKPLAVSPPRTVTGGHEEFEVWLDDATLAAAGIVRPATAAPRSPTRCRCWPAPAVTKRDGPCSIREYPRCSRPVSPRSDRPRSQRATR